VSDDDLIRRGDALNALKGHWFHAPMFHSMAKEAIAAIPAATPDQIAKLAKGVINNEN